MVIKFLVVDFLNHHVQPLPRWSYLPAACSSVIFRFITSQFVSSVCPEGGWADTD